jgi:acetoacetyl-CoA synthetase
MLGNPILPVYRGEIQCLGLGMDVSVFNDKNEEVFNEKGELVCRKPFVSMPLYLWNDYDNSIYKIAFFSLMNNVWFHGDYVCHTSSQGSSGGLIVYGRSDTTLNPGGVRIGTAEIYRLVENVPEIEDSIVIGKPRSGDIEVILFVKLVPQLILNEELKKKINSSIKNGASPKHVPDKIVQVQKIPYTISGKKVELAVLDIVMGNEPKNRSALADPDALECYRNIKDLY